MTDIESQLRATLTDERRTLDAPADISTWVAAGVSRQRKRTAAAATIATVAVLAVGSAVVLPIVLRDDPATYVAGSPDEETGLLAWEPVGSLIEDSAAIEDAVQAWSDDAPETQQPDGDVYVLMAGDEVGGGDGAYLQGRSAEGEAVLAFLSRDADSADWTLVDTTGISDPSSTEFVVVPQPEDVEGSAVAVLAPKWRDVPARWLEQPIGWSQVVSSSRVINEWRLVYRSFPNDWLFALGEPLSGEVSHRVLLHGGENSGQLVEVLASGESRHVGTDTGTVVNSVDARPPEPEVLRPGLKLADELYVGSDLVGPDVTMTLVSQASRRVPLTASTDQRVEMSVVLLEPEKERSLIAAIIQKPDGRVICGSRKFVPDDVLRGYVVAGVCPVALWNGQKSLWLLGRWDIGEDINPDMNLTLDVERVDGTVRTFRVSQRARGVIDERLPAERAVPYYSQFVVRGLDPFEGTPFDPWVWPAQWLGIR